MASRTVVLAPRPPNASCLAQKGILTKTKSRQRQSSRLTTLPLTDEAEAAAAAAGEEDTHRRGKTIACETWIARHAVIACHHRCASAFGLREEMAEQKQRRRADEHDDDRRAQ